MEALEEPSVMAQNTLSDEEFYARIGGPFCQRNPTFVLNADPTSGEDVLAGFTMPLRRLLL